MRIKTSVVANVILFSVALSACAETPLGPTVSVLPPPSKPFSVFQQDDTACRDYAGQQVQAGVNRANNDALTAGAVTTGIGGVLGAVAGGGKGLGIGLLAGGAAGTGIGAGLSQREQRGIQRQYDIAYSQCMYSRGNQVPGTGRASVPPPPRG